MHLRIRHFRCSRHAALTRAKACKVKQNRTNCFSTIEGLKHRHISNQLEYTIEVDAYRGKQKGLVVAEIEFESVKESEEFKINKPEWLVEDITLDEGYKNKNLANG